MKKLVVFLIGIGVGVIFFILGIILKNHSLIANIVGLIGLISLLFSGASVGALVSGDRIRANYWSESKQSRTDRFDFGIKAALFGVPLVLSALGIYLFV
ncbi:DUF5316 family protein [Sporolactobacillus kofuensis]|uniref:DUF5316 family protein n=1 Tax=Sporolactobacillus kofuensis TaxID=269672 RepID=A0ABW1WDZ4_9BACL|nr:DUF5316 domain-containing protein [Sporolactobacillus kofuensis]MCO7174981.1 DUF5316 domain-containing protein [Sporolactobacillus kofuensis]